MTNPQDGGPFQGGRVPGGQPPPEYPGQAYGQYQPPASPPVEPPRKPRWRRYGRVGCLGIIALVVLIVVISVIASSGGGVKTSPSGTSSPSTSTSPSATSSPSAKTAGVGSYFDVSDSSGHTYRVTLVKVIDPAKPSDQFNAPDNGKHLVGVVFRIKALSGSPQDEDSNNDAAIVGSDGQTYNFDLATIAGYTNFSDGSINIAQGDTQTGAVTFQVPDGVKVTRVQWSASSGFGSTVQWNVK